MRVVCVLLAVAAVSSNSALRASAQTALPYQMPPAPIEQLLDAPPTPVVVASPDGSSLLIEQPATFPSIAEVAQPRYRLAGIRFNPVNSSPSVQTYHVALRLQALDGTGTREIAGLPPQLRAVNASWSPDSKHIAFTQRDNDGLALWVVDVTSARAHPVRAVRMNAVLGRTPCVWMPDSVNLLCKTVPVNRGPVPKPNQVPTGPHISENLGKVTPAPTYEDMLETPDDERIFEYYATSQLSLIPLSGAVHDLHIKGMLDRVSPSPDGKYALVTAIHRPFSYTVPYERFPLLTQVVTLKTGAAKVLTDRPVVDNLPISRDAVEPGPRETAWRSDVPSTLVWVEAADGGDPKVESAVRDRLKALPAPFTGQPTVILELPMRLQRGFGEGSALAWGNEHLAIATESRWADRRTRTVAFDPSAPGKVTTLYEGSSQDRYHSPGRPVTAANASGHPVLQLTPDGSAIYFFSPGATPAGDQPFVGTVPVAGGPEQILVRSGQQEYADPVALLPGGKALFRRESATVQPNWWTYNLTAPDAAPKQVTSFPSPYAGIALPTRQLLRYKRSDGLDLTATLWLPAGYDKSQGPLPTLLEAYPAEFKTRAAAAQVAGSTNRFPSFGWGGSPVYFAQVGYAVLENTAIPIIGEGHAEPNDTYVEQLVAGAKAAVDYSVSLGVVDPKRIGVMGHSYGAFMTANLLAHSDLFRAGIARSGAYNRTLTPYGFQNEERTYWQAPEVYYNMSPFSAADKIKAPLLLIHGEADDNTGTFPIQSERFYAALKGQGATVRLVFLPLEPHHYGAHESLQHMLWEMDRWLDTYVKPPVAATKQVAAE